MGPVILELNLTRLFILHVSHRGTTETGRLPNVCLCVREYGNRCPGLLELNVLNIVRVQLSEI